MSAMSRAGNPGKQQFPHGSAGTHAAQQKRIEREKAERIKVRLDELITARYPERVNETAGGSSGARKTIEIQRLLQDAIKVVREARKSIGLPEPTVTRANKPSGKRGKCMTPKMREERLRALPTPASPLSTGGVSEAGGLSAALSRAALLNSVTTGAMLVRTKDMLVVESSRAVELFCWGTREGMMRGYRDQHLTAAIHWEDSFALRDLQTAALDGSLVKGSTLSCRLLRLNHEVESGCLLAGLVRVLLLVAHVSPDGASMLLTFDMKPSMERPLQTTPQFWQRYYAPGAGVAGTISKLF
mmetsp:Transcript_4267/g.9696  ORF Transcript_4267/g.9696 Transcript_4267/m.9696 type:complete len:300 (+) Transcript_4267:158-1057(+)